MILRVLTLFLCCFLLVPTTATGRTEAETLLRQLEGRDARERARAAFRLGQIDAVEAIPQLIVALGDGSRSVRANAATSLWNMSDHATAAMPALRGVLGDPYGPVARNAAGALRAMGVPDAELLPVYRRLLTDADCGVAISAMRWLEGEAPSAELFPHALACTRVSDIDDRLDAGKILRDLMEDRSIAPLIIDALVTSGEQGVANLLLGISAYQPPVVEAVGAVSAYLDSGLVENRAAAASALGRMQALATLAGLMRAMAADDDAGVREAAAEAIGNMGADAVGALDALATTAADDPWPNVREAAIRALGELGPAAGPAAPVLYAALEESDGHLRVAARNALFRVDPDNKQRVVALEDATAAAPAAGGASTRLFEDVSGLPEALAEGPAELVEAHVYRDFAIVTGRESTSRSGWGRFTYRNGVLGGPEEGSASCEKTFRAGDADLSLIPALVAKAIDKAGGGSVSVVTLSRGVFCKQLGWQVVLDGGTRASRIEFDLKGRVKKVWP